LKTVLNYKRKHTGCNYTVHMPHQTWQTSTAWTFDLSYTTSRKVHCFVLVAVTAKLYSSSSTTHTAGN